MKKIFYILLLFPALLISQHSVKGGFPISDEYKWVILYKITPEVSEYIANEALNEAGAFEIVLDSSVSSGMYRLVYGLPQEEFNFDIIYNGKEDIVFTFNPEIGIEFISSSENQLISSYTQNMGMISQAIGEYFRLQKNDSISLVTLFDTQRETQEEFEKVAEGTIALNFITGNKPYIPEGFEDIKTYIQNLQEHFFENVDFNNEILQSSNFLVERVLNYVFGITASDLDEIENYKNNIDRINKVLTNSSNFTKKNILQVVWQQFADTSNEQIAIYISDSQLMDLAELLKDEELLTALKVYKRLSLGAIAPDFNFEVNTDTGKVNSKLSEIEGFDKYIVLFWSSTCGHCLQEIPELYNYLNGLEDESIKVLAIGLEEDSFRWRVEAMKYPDFLHVLGLGKWDNEIGNSYNVTETPSYFLLDSDKKIIAKPLDLEALIKHFQAQK